MEKLYSLKLPRPRFAAFFGLAILAPALVSFTAHPAFGQAATASVEGSVLDSTGAAVPDADVVVANPALAVERRAKSSGAGVFTVSDLTPAPGYTVTVTKTGFAKYTVKTFDLAIGQALYLTVSLALASTGTEVNVTSDAPIVETTKTDVSAS